MGRKPDSNRYFCRTKEHRFDNSRPYDRMYYVVFPGNHLRYVSSNLSYGPARAPYRMRHAGYEYIKQRVDGGDIVEIGYDEVPASVLDRFNAVVIPSG